MNKNYYIKIFSFLSLIILVMFSSCEEEDPINSGEVVLLSFGPSGVKHGEEIIFIGENLDKVASVVLKPDITIEKSEFIDVSSESFKIVIPQSTEAGKVILNTSQGEIESKSVLSFEVDVTISSITSEARPGTNITITGTKINWIESVTFESDVMVEKDDFVSQSQTELVVTVPMEAQSGFLIFGTGGTEPLTFASEEELIVTSPIVATISPSSIRHENDLTITGTDLDLVTELVFTPETSVSSADFVSHSATEIVVTVPASAETGVVILKQLSPVEVETEELSIILPVATDVSPVPAIPGEDDLTITGTDLDLVSKLTLPGNVEVEAAEFISHSATEIVFAIPAEATQGSIGYETIHGYSNDLGVVLKLPSAGSLPTLDYYIYKDGLQNDWQAWGGWGHVSQEYQNSENPASGDFAIKTVFNDAYGAIQIHNGTGVDNPFSGYNYLVFYVYVQGEESDVIVQLSGFDDYYSPHFVGDKYHQIVIPLEDLSGFGETIGELHIKNNNSDAATNNTVVFVDEIGLTVDMPEAPFEAPDTYIYKDALDAGWQAWDGWGHSSKDWASSNNPYMGSSSIEVTYNDNYGALQIHPLSNTALVGYSELVLYVYFESDGDYAVQFNDGAEESFAVKGGQYNKIVIDLSGYSAEISNLNELRLKNYGTTQNHTVYIDEIGLNF